MTTTVGEAATTEIRNLTFNDESVIAPLLELKQNYPNSDIFISGNLTVDFPEDIQIPLKKNNYVTASLSGTTLKISYCLIDDAIALLKEQYAVGTVEVKIIQTYKAMN